MPKTKRTSASSQDLQQPKIVRKPSTALIMAIEFANAPVIMTLLTEKSVLRNINTKNEKNKTPFFYTSLTFDYQVINLLIDNGAVPIVNAAYLDSFYIAYKEIHRNSKDLSALQENFKSTFALLHTHNIDVSEFVSALITYVWDMSLYYQQIIPLAFFIIETYGYSLDLDMDGVDVPLIRYFFQYEAEDARAYEGKLCEDIVFSPLSLTQIEMQYGKNTGFLKKLLVMGADINTIDVSSDIPYSVFDAIYDSIIECIGTEEAQMPIVPIEESIEQWDEDSYECGEQKSGYWNEAMKKPLRYDEANRTQYHCHLEPNKKALNDILDIIFEYAQNIKLSTLVRIHAKARNHLTKPNEKLRESTLIGAFVERLGAQIELRNETVLNLVQKEPLDVSAPDIATRLAYNFLVSHSSLSKTNSPSEGRFEPEDAVRSMLL